MTTEFLDYKICTFTILLSWRFPRKTAVLDDLPLCPQCPPPQKRKFYLYCRLAVSEDRFQIVRFDSLAIKNRAIHDSHRPIRDI